MLDHGELRDDPAVLERVATVIDPQHPKGVARDRDRVSRASVQSRGGGVTQDTSSSPGRAAGDDHELALRKLGRVEPEDQL